MQSLKKFFFLCSVVIALTSIAFAQGDLGALTGSLLDASGAVVPDASITITQMNTGVKWEAKSSTAGYYRVAVPRGKYRIEVRKEGFKTAVAENILVPVAQVVSIDFTLQVGGVTEAVTVTSEAPLLTTATAEVGSSVSPLEFATLPIAVDDGGRQLQTFIFTSLPGTVGDPFSGSINGGQLFSSEILIDGISIARYDLSGGSLVEFSPSTDAIGEFKVQQTNFSAEYGETGGGIANFSMKSGTNEFHGTVYDYFKNDALNAAGFNTNAFGAAKRTIKENDFGGTIGGPIRKGRTFFFYAYEGDRFRSFNISGLTTLPTVPMRQGDFSAWLTQDPKSPCFPSALPCAIGTDALGRPVYFDEIYDPTTTRRANGQVVRDAFGFDPVTGLPIPGQANVIPPPMFSKASSVLLPLFPDPQFNSLLRNQPRLSGCCPILNVDKTSAKVDHVINAQQKLTGSFNWIKRDRFNRNAASFLPFPGFPLNPVKRQIVGGPQIRLAHNWTLNDHTVNEITMGYNRFNNANNITPNNKYTPQLGIPGVPNDCFPPFKFRGHVGQLGSFGVGCENIDPSESYIWTDTLSYLRGRHGLKFGGEFRRYRYNTFEPGPRSGSFTFSDRETALANFADQTGHPFASFVLGAVDSGSRSVYTTEPGYRAGIFTFFAQDDWKTTPKLTLNLGVRWEIPLPKKEAFNRQSGLDPTVPNTSNDPSIPAADGIPGALVFLGNCQGCINRASFQDTYLKEVAPRFGVAYQLSTKLVFRGGYGISFGPPILNNFGSQNLFGFNSSVPLPRGTSPTGFSLDPVTYWSPLAGAAIPASAQVGVPPFTGVLPNRNAALANGNGIDFLPPKSLAQPYTQNWSSGFQYEFPGQVLFEANYIGSKGSRLLQSMFSNMNNQVPTKYAPLGDMLSEDLADDLADPAKAATLAQYGITALPYPSFEATNFNPIVAQALRPFPQYDVITNNYPTLGSSTYHSLQVTGRKRAASGLTFIAAYTYSKTLTNSDTALYYPTGGFGVFNFGQDFYNRKAEKSLASFDFPHFLKLTWIYDLPFGPGKRWLSSGGGALEKVVGGWTVTAIQNYHSGDPLAIVTDQCTQLYNGPYGDGCGVRPDLVSGVPLTLSSQGLDAINGTPYLNPAAFVDPPFTGSGAFASRLGSAARFARGIRGTSSSSEDLGILKRTHLGERLNLEFRADFFNLFNRTGRGDPDTDVDSGTFGLIFGPQRGGRVVQLAMRLTF